MAKKTEVITFRTDSETKNNLTKIAEDNDWSIAQVVDKICKEYFKYKKEETSPIINQITINNNQNSK